MAHKLLLADDSITIQKVVELILPEDEFDVTSVGNGRDAWEKVEENIPDIVLADIEMPELDGYELCRKVRNDPRSAGVPVILLAGAFESFDTSRAREVGATDHVIKPFESSELIAKISAALGTEPVVEIEEAEELMVAEVDEVEDGEEMVTAEVEEAPVAEAVEATAAVEPGAEGDGDDDLWGAEEIPEVGDEPMEWEEALEGAVEAEDVDDSADLVAEPAEDFEDAAVVADVLEEEFEAVVAEEPAESVAVIEEEPIPGGDAGTEEMEQAEDAEAVEEESAEEVAEAEEAAVSAETAPAAPRVTVSAEDLREEVRAAVAAAIPSADEIAGIVRESVSAATSGADPEAILGQAAKDAMPASSAILETVREAATPGDLADTVKAVLRDELEGKLDSLVRETVEKVLWEVLPDTAERVSRQILQESAPVTLKNAFEKVAWETVPDIAERLITEEIARIKGEH